MSNIQIIDAVLANLNCLNIQGLQNMAILIDATKALGAVRDRLKAEQKEEKSDVQADTK